MEDDHFDPNIKEIAGNIKAITDRDSSDDNSQIMLFVEVCRAWKEVYGSLSCKIVLLFEGKKESGSPSLTLFLNANA